ncbi:flagellar basal body P-ring formation chaperone FlgA [Magnetovibrio sp. PR-2]|uniref:flagellar basal body P-ring formation chaperone FlgA n=1 Tax=Magnetovibrio sp. PR-2 TaxID=3120356 RepID=UPI002FCE3BA7
MKLITILLALGLLLAAPMGQANAKDAKGAPAPEIDFITLNNHIVIQDGVIRLGDVFQNAGKYAERVVAYAPRPGTRSVFDARWLRRVAKAFKMDWRPGSAAERIVVERESQIVNKSEVEEILYERLIAEGADPNARVQLSNRSFRLDLPVGEEYLLGIEQMNYDMSNSRFSAILIWGTGKDERRRVSGRMERMSEVPVLSSRLMKGDIISKHDLDWVSMPQSRLARNAVTDSSRIVGMAAKRAIAPGKPISSSDIRRPLAVTKGDLVTMVLSTPAMRLTVQGKALQSGSKGDTIRITNTQTRTVVEATVTGAGEARVEAPLSVALR